jgi:hypothetical protein
MRFDPAAESIVLIWREGHYRASGVALFEPSKNKRRTHCRVEWLPSVAEKTAWAGHPGIGIDEQGHGADRCALKSELIGRLTRFPAGMYDDGVDARWLIGRDRK